MNLVQAQEIYAAAIEPTTPAAGGLEWWREVHKELQAVVAAPSNKAAASFIEWWHHDWARIGDSPVRAAGRIRKAAAKMLKT